MNKTLNSLPRRQMLAGSASALAAAGRFRGPVALAPSPGGDLLVLETLNRRIQAVDVHGNPIPVRTVPGTQPSFSTSR